jgi:hypothetical protein
MSDDPPPAPYPSPTNPVCGQCGSSLLPDDRFCPACGAAVMPAAPVRVVRQAALPEYPSPRIGTKGKIALAILAVVGVLSVIIYTAGQNRPDPGAITEVHDLAGTIVVEHPLILVGPDGCVFPPPNQALVPGSLIHVLDEDGESIATGKIADSALVDHGVCHLHFTIPQVPAAREYRLVVNGVRLPGINRSNFERFGWNLEIRLNDFQEARGAGHGL